MRAELADLLLGEDRLELASHLHHAAAPVRLEGRDGLAREIRGLEPGLEQLRGTVPPGGRAEEHDVILREVDADGLDRALVVALDLILDDLRRGPVRVRIGLDGLDGEPWQLQRRPRRP